MFVRALWPLLSGLVLTGCWKTDLQPLPVGRIAFEPTAQPIAGWVVEEFETSTLCPDNSTSSIYAVYPTAPTAPVPVAVILHSGAFDYIIDPPANDPIGGPAYHEPARLTHTWSVRKAYATLGMYDDNDPVEQSIGALAASFANAGVAMLIPANCWGDHWHNQQGVAENDFATEHFYRQGRFLSAFSWQIASEPGFAAAQGIDIPISIDTGRNYLVGLGEGGRGVGDLLANGAEPDAILIDSSADDLRTYYADPVLYEATITGLNRIYPGGVSTTEEASLANIPNLPPTAYIYSSLDAQIPNGAHDAVLAVLDDTTDMVVDAAVQRHVITSSDATLATDAVTFLVTQ